MDLPLGISDTEFDCSVEFFGEDPNESITKSCFYQVMKSDVTLTEFTGDE